MKQILIGTTNPSKVTRFAGLLQGRQVQLLTLHDLGITAEPDETGKTPSENAAIKARFYGQYFDAVICGDSGLYLEGMSLDDPRQPGLHVRTPMGSPRMDDQALLAYYTDLVRSLSGRVTAYYLDGFAVYHCGTVSTFQQDVEAAREGAFDLVDISSGDWHEGWPLDSISVYKDTWRYFTDPDQQKLTEAKENIIQGDYRTRLVAFLCKALKL